MNVMRDAFEKVGIKKDSKESKESYGTPRKTTIPKWTAYSSLKDNRFFKILEDEKSRKFGMHLLHSFVAGSQHRVIDDWSCEGDRKRTCDICRCKIESLRDVSKDAKPLTDIPDGISDVGWGEIVRNKIEEFLKSDRCKSLANGSKESDVVMCRSCIYEFVDFIKAELFSGNGFVQRILKEKIGG